MIGPSGGNSEAARFLRERQSLFAQSSFSRGVSSQYLKEKVAENPSLAAAIDAGEREDYALFLLERLRDRLPAQIYAVLMSDSVAIGEVNDPSPYACCHLVARNSFTISFNSGLRDFNYRVIRALATRFQIEGQDEAATVSFDDTCRYIADIFLWFGETDESHGPDYPLTDAQFTLANLLTLEVNAFFLAHEIGHGILHLDRGLSGGEDPYAGISLIDEEFVADDFASRALLARPDGSRAVDVSLSYAAIEIALLIWCGLEKFGIEFSKSHPAADKRLKAIRNSVLGPGGGSSDGIGSFAKPVSEVFENALDRISVGNYDALIDNAAEDFMLRLENLLDRCTGGPVPDYMTFYREADQLFLSGFSTKLGETMAKVGESFRRRVTGDPAWTSMADMNHAVISIQRFKLFVGYVGHLSPKMRSVFSEALALPPNFYANFDETAGRPGQERE